MAKITPQQQKDLDKLLEHFPQVDLHPDLKKHLIETDNIGIILQHPLVYGVPYFEVSNHQYNEQYKYKKDAVEKALKKKDWGRYVFMHERPHRLTALEEIMYVPGGDYEDNPELSNKEYWEIFSACWTDSENLHQIWNLTDFLMARNGREHMMSDDEKELFDALPDEFMVYRGHQGKNPEGHSWTLSYSKARWFADRLARKDDERIVSEGMCLKSWVIAVMLSRGEYEVIVECPDMMGADDVEELERDSFLEEMLDSAKSQFVLKPNSDHGPAHWEKVERNVLCLSEGMSAEDILTCRLFAIFHDCKRENEMDDPEHGLRASQFVHEAHPHLVDKIGQERVLKLMYACEHHNTGSTEDDPIVGTCWDADRLDLIRVGIVPNPKLMSTGRGYDSILKI